MTALLRKQFLLAVELNLIVAVRPIIGIADGEIRVCDGRYLWAFIDEMAMFVHLYLAMALALAVSTPQNPS